jgi:DNA-binding IclR family transcriptional regulator
VLYFFVVHPGRRFTLSEVAEALHVRAGTLLTILQALADRGYLARHPRHKTYVLGPALVAAGHSVLLPHPIVDFARHELELMAEETGIECTATLAMGNDLVLIASAGRSRSSDPMLVWTGARLPIERPFGAPFVAWADDETIGRWIGVEYRAELPERAARLELMLTGIRERGYCLSEETRSLSESLIRPRTGARSVHPGEETEPASLHIAGSMIDEIEGGPRRAEINVGLQHLTDQIVALNLGERPIADTTSVAVPVFGHGADVPLVLTAHSFVDRLTDESLRRLVEQLTRCATLITKDTFAGRS